MVRQYAAHLHIHAWYSRTRFPWILFRLPSFTQCRRPKKRDFTDIFIFVQKCDATPIVREPQTRLWRFKLYKWSIDQMSKSPSQPAGDGVKTESDMSGQQQVSQSQSGQNATSNGQQSSGTHSSQELDHIVAQYLQKKGYRQTEAMLRREANSKTIPLSEMSSRFRPQDDPSMSDHVLFYSEAESGNPDAYDISYKSLRGWIENSLDWYKVCRLYNGVFYELKEKPSNKCQQTSPNYDPSYFLSLYIRTSTLYQRSCTSKVIYWENSMETNWKIAYSWNHTL